MLVAVVEHRPELNHRERIAAQTRALLPEKNRTAELRADQDRDRQDQRQQVDQGDYRHHDVDQPLDHPLHRSEPGVLQHIGIDLVHVVILLPRSIGIADHCRRERGIVDKLQHRVVKRTGVARGHEETVLAVFHGLAAARRVGGELSRDPSPWPQAPSAVSLRDQEGRRRLTLGQSPGGTSFSDPR